VKVKIKRGFLVHCGDTFLEGKEGSIIDISDNEILEAVGDFVEILDHYPTTGKYKVIRAFDGHAIDETIDLFSDQASKLVLTRKVEPVDNSLWSPGKPMPSTKKSFSQRIMERINK